MGDDSPWHGLAFASPFPPGPNFSKFFLILSNYFKYFRILSDSFGFFRISPNPLTCHIFILPHYGFILPSFWLLLGEPRARQVASRHCFRMGRGYQPRIADRRISARRFPFLVSLAFAYAHDNLDRPQIINLLSPTGEISA